jgi:tetratricopeptide (TPR) repeat protein
VLFVSGRVATNDGTPLPNNVTVERICNEKVRQQVYASLHGEFTMQLGSLVDSFVDASAQLAQVRPDPRNPSLAGVSRRELATCDLRVSAAGFHQKRLSLMELTTFGQSIDVGSIVVQRGTKVQGTTVNAAIYRVPDAARKAYEKGLDAENSGKLANARAHFERAVAVYPKFASAWLELGNVLQAQRENDAARDAYTKAATTDPKFVPPFLQLAAMACETQNWKEVLDFTRHILDLDAFKSPGGYTLDLDKYAYAEAYFYDALANFHLDRIADAERSALKAEQELRTRSPRLHLLLGEIFAREKHYANAILELQTYLELAPHAANADQVRASMAKWQTLNASAPTADPDPR